MTEKIISDETTFQQYPIVGTNYCHSFGFFMELIITFDALRQATHGNNLANPLKPGTLDYHVISATILV